MSTIVSRLRSRFSGTLKELFGEEVEGTKNIGIYGPPNTGKTTLANQIVQDWAESVEDDEGVSHIPHETRQAERKTVTIEDDNGTVELDVVDTPGVSTEVDYNDFTEYDLEEEEAIKRSREATEGIAEAMRWLREDIDGVIYVMDSTEDPFTQVNTMLLGIIESKDLPVLVFANKIDLEESNVRRIEDAFPQHTVVEISALEGENIETAYEQIVETFG